MSMLYRVVFVQNLNLAPHFRRISIFYFVFPDTIFREMCLKGYIDGQQLSRVAMTSLKQLLSTVNGISLKVV